MILWLLFIFSTWCITSQEQDGSLGRFQEVFAWKQLTYDVNGYLLLHDRFGNGDTDKRSDDQIIFEIDNEEDKEWNSRPQNNDSGANDQIKPSDEAGRFFVQYNNIPMGVEKVDDMLFITVPRRRYGILSTLNYIDLKEVHTKSPPLRPYPNIWESRALTSVYRTRADKCGRLWMVDTGLMEIPDNPQQVQPPAIVIFDLNRHKQILRYPFKTSDIPAANTPTGLASITIDTSDGCDDAYAYVPDITTFGIIVYSLRRNDSWRHSHVYFHFNPTASNLYVAGQSFQWNDGIFSITLTDPGPNGCRTAFFHPMISTQEFSVSTCVLKNNTVMSRSNYFTFYSIIGDRGPHSQSTMHGFEPNTRVIFFADIGRDAISCWNTDLPLQPSNIGLLAQDTWRLSYPSDLHVTDDEVWVMANTLPRFSYSRLHTNEYNFYVYRGKVRELISGTTLPNGSSSPSGAEINLQIAKTKESVNKKVLELCTPEWKKLEQRGADVIETPRLMLTDMTYIRIPSAACELDVFVDLASLSAGSVNARPRGVRLEEQLLTLTEKMAEYCQSELGKEPYLPAHEELCIALCPPYPQWFRAVLCDQVGGPGGSQVRLCYIDYGNLETVSVTDVRKMLPEFIKDLPALSLHVNIRGFPQNPSTEILTKALTYMNMDDEGRGTLKVTNCHEIGFGMYEADAPGLIDALK